MMRPVCILNFDLDDYRTAAAIIEKHAVLMAPGEVKKLGDQHRADDQYAISIAHDGNMIYVENNPWKFLKSPVITEAAEKKKSEKKESKSKVTDIG